MNENNEINMDEPLKEVETIESDNQLPETIVQPPIKMISNKKDPLLIIIPVVIIIALSCALAYYFFTKNNNQHNVSVSSGTTELVSGTVKLDYSYIGSYADGLIAVSDGTKIGYVDKTGKIIIPLKFKFVNNSTLDEIEVKTSEYSFNNNRLVATEDGKNFGVYDKTGKNIIPSKYQSIMIHGDRMVTQLNDKYSLLDLDGKTIIAEQSERIYLYDDYAEIGDYIYDINGKKIFDKTGHFSATVLTDEVTSKNIFVVIDNNRVSGTTNKSYYTYNYYSFAGKPILPRSYRLSDIVTDGPFGYETPMVFWYRNGLLHLYDNDTKQSGVIDETGKIVVPMTKEYIFSDPFYDNVNLAEFGASGIEGNSTGFMLIDKTGKRINSDIYNSGKIQPIDGLWNLSMTSKNGVVSSDGATIIPFEYDTISILNKNRFLVSNQDETYNTSSFKIIDSENQEIAKSKNNKWTSAYQLDSYINITVDGEHGLIDYDGNKIIDAKYDNIWIDDKVAICIAGADKYVIVLK